MLCTVCTTEKPTAEFTSTSRAREHTGRGTCSACFNLKYNRPKGQAPGGTRKCRTCGQRKPPGDFDPMPEKPGKLQRSCRECFAGNGPEEKTCLRCGLTKAREEFGIRRDRAGRKGECKACLVERVMIYARSDPERTRRKFKIWLGNNREARRAYMRKYLNDRYATDPAFRLTVNLRNRVAASVNRALNNTPKAGSAVRDLGCTSLELKAYLEAQFLPGMTWENHAGDGWHIDHIKPLADFDLTDRARFLAACHYTNLQPLWGKDNLLKRVKDGVLQRRPRPVPVVRVPGTGWEIVSKADPRCRALADLHYTRQSVGASQFTRPGYNLVLYRPGAVFVWWRPKWEAGIPGTRRKDGLECIECTLFRNQGSGVVSSQLILEAEAALAGWARAHDVPIKDGLVTAVGIPQTADRRGRRSRPGECYLRAGWEAFPHPTSKRADLAWLRKDLPKAA